MRYGPIPVSAVAKIRVPVKVSPSAAVCLEEITLSQRKEQSLLAQNRGGTNSLTDKGVNRMP